MHSVMIQHKCLSPLVELSNTTDSVKGTSIRTEQKAAVKRPPPQSPETKCLHHGETQSKPASARPGSVTFFGNETRTEYWNSFFLKKMQLGLFQVPIHVVGFSSPYFKPSSKSGSARSDYGSLFEDWVKTEF
jgi:hypothetical protein